MIQRLKDVGEETKNTLKYFNIQVTLRCRLKKRVMGCGEKITLYSLRRMRWRQSTFASADSAHAR